MIFFKTLLSKKHNNTQGEGSLGLNGVICCLWERSLVGYNSPLLQTMMSLIDTRKKLKRYLTIDTT